MEANFVQVGDENYINLANIARVRFSSESAEIFYIGGQTESITDSLAIENLRKAIAAEVIDTLRKGNASIEPRKAMDIAHPIASRTKADKRG